MADLQSETGGEAVRRREFDFLVDVDSDLSQPGREFPKHIEFRWVGAGQLDLLDDNRGKDDGLVRRLVEVALRSAGRAERTCPHATIFLDRAGETVEELRHAWDPAMADQIAAHISVAYPCEADDTKDMCNRAARAARDAIPFRLRLGRAEYAEAKGRVFLEVEDLDAVGRTFVIR